MGKSASLQPRQFGGGDQTVVVAHGIRQDATGMYAFADALGAYLPTWDVKVFDYDWTQPLVKSGAQLADALQQVDGRSVGLVGYSMGGLVARLAVADHKLDMVDTVITLATPNRGAITPSQLWPLGQEFVAGLRFVSPLAHCDGVLDLTDINERMIQRRRDPAKKGAVKAAVLNKRYASVPALYFHPDRSWRALGTPMGWPSSVLSLLTRMPRPHDGIVSEDRNDITRRGSTNFAEFDLAQFDGKTPARAHAAHIAARELDHISVLGSSEVAGLVASLLATPDWRDLQADEDLNFALG